MGFRFQFFKACLVSVATVLVLASQGVEAKSDDAEFYSGEEEVYTAPYVGPKIKVNVAARQLHVFDENDEHVKTYPIAIGSTRYKTPLGKREMKEIVWNPWWIPPKNSAWAAGAKDTPPGPNNPLGQVKMKLGEAIMFHGTNKPKSIGRAESHGCMRMFTEDAKELAAWIQQRVMNNKTTPETYAEFMSKVEANKRSSFYVQIENPVPIDIVYELAEVKDGKLNIYQDVYWRIKDKVKEVEAALKSAGYKSEDFDLDYIRDQIKMAKNSSDLSFELNFLLKKNKHLRDDIGQVAVNQLSE